MDDAHDVDAAYQPAANITALITTMRIDAESNRVTFTDWLSKLMISGAKFPGFWSGEIIPPKNGNPNEWKMVQWFASPEAALAWKQSEVRATVIGEHARLIQYESVSPADGISFEERSAGVATAILTEVKPGMEADYWSWEQKVQSVQAKYAGYRGVYLSPPVPGRKDQWTTLLRFDSPEHLNAWFASDERRSLLAEADEFVRATHFQNLSSSFPGWFPSNDKMGDEPPRWKTAALVMVGLFPIIVTLRFISLPLLNLMNRTAYIAINSLISVALVSWFAMPLLVKLFHWWLLPGGQNRLKMEITGLILTMGLFALEVLLLWKVH
jgi:antibiotic biosynthesis monooxygenase (ABM) superfamily enzyme